MKTMLYLQSTYSMLKSMITIDDLVLACKENGFTHIALSDENLHAVYELNEVAKTANLTPIFGLKVVISDKRSYLLYALNDKGYKNLVKIASLKGHNIVLTLEDIVANQQGLAIVSVDYYERIKTAQIYEMINDEQKFFNTYYVGLSASYEEEQLIYKYCLSHKIAVLPVNQTGYIKEEDLEIYQILRKIGNETINLDNQNLRFLSKDELLNRFSIFPSILNDLEVFIKSVTFKLEFPKFMMPTFKAKNTADNHQYLISLANYGLKRRLQLNTIIDDGSYQKRLNHELEVLSKMNFENYFLIVYDFVNFAKKHDILVGPGRGSAAGSLVSYCLGITDVDPIKYNLMFERFLNPARMNMPDIDLDFPDDKRDIVIDYVANKYGQDHICSITTFGTFQTRVAIRDIVRAKALPAKLASTIIALHTNNNIEKTDLKLVDIVNTANRLEGLVRQTGTHAAGIILSEQPLTDYIPMQSGTFKFNQSQFDAKTLEKLGLHKIDFLGIKNLSVIAKILKILEEKGTKINLSDIPFDDKKTYDLLKDGNTTGIFQLESSGIRRVLKNLQPSEFEDIVATIALYRPGPMDNIDTYVSRKKGKAFNYLHESLRPILKDTHGIIIYQEQIMKIAQVFAGYDLFDADMLRVGISKKKLDILEKEETKFINGAISLGYDHKLAKTIYEYILKFADYGFNRSHSVSYAIVAYQMAYLKANYFNEFMQVLLSSVIGNESQTNEYINEAIIAGVNVVNPSLNISDIEYTLNANKDLVMPLSTIKSLGKKTVSEIIIRRNNQPFKSLTDIKMRLNGVINEQQYNNLVYAQALNFLGYNEKTLIDNNNLKSFEYEKHIIDYQLMKSENYSLLINAENEKNAIGINLTYQLNDLSDSLNKIGYNQNTIVKAILKQVTEMKTKNNNDMLIVSLGDINNEISAVVFEDVLIKKIRLLTIGNLYHFDITKQKYRDKESFILNKITEI